MALVKRTYVDGETIITAQNLNDIQDEIISHANTFVPKTRTINSKALDANITLTASDLSAVPTTRTVNSKALSSNITLTAADVGAVPTTRTVNSKALSSNITLTSGDIGYNSSTTYSSGSVGKEVSDLNGAINAITPLDSTPTNGSTKGVTSDGVFDAIGLANYVSAYDWITNNTTTVSGSSLPIRQIGNLLYMSGYVNLNGSIAGNNAVLGTFSTVKPSGQRRIYGYAKYNNNQGFYFFNLNADGTLTTATGSGTFTDSVLFVDTMTFA